MMQSTVIKRAVHEGVKYPWRQCDNESTSKGNLTPHKRAVDEGVKYPCRQCDHQSTSKSHLAQHKRAVHEGIKFTCRQCDNHLTSKVISLDTKGHNMKDSGILAHNAIINPPQREILLNANRAVHEAIKYPCIHCGKKFSKKIHLI